MNSEEFYCVTGIDPDLREATRSAARNMIEFLGAEHGLSRVEAYMLCSVVADLKMLEVVSSQEVLMSDVEIDFFGLPKVDMPNYAVS